MIQWKSINNSELCEFLDDQHLLTTRKQKLSKDRVNFTCAADRTLKKAYLFSLTSLDPQKKPALSWQHWVKITQAYFPQAENKMERDHFGQTRSKWLLIRRSCISLALSRGMQRRGRRRIASGHRLPLSDGQIPLLMQRNQCLSG